KPTDRILFLTDSWGTFPEETNPLNQTRMFDGHLINGRCFMPKEFIKEFVANGGDENNVLLATRGEMTTVWAKYWLPKFISDLRPDKIVFHFGINDLNSKAYHSNPDNAYRFDPENIWASKNIEDGGMIGSIPDNEAYKQNISWLHNYCTKQGVIPIFFTPPKTASSSQAHNLSNLARDMFFSGIDKI